MSSEEFSPSIVPQIPSSRDGRQEVGSLFDGTKFTESGDNPATLREAMVGVLQQLAATSAANPAECFVELHGQQLVELLTSGRISLVDLVGRECFTPLEALAIEVNSEEELAKRLTEPDFEISAGSAKKVSKMVFPNYETTHRTLGISFQLGDYKFLLKRDADGVWRLSAVGAETETKASVPKLWETVSKILRIKF